MTSENLLFNFEIELVTAILLKSMDNFPMKGKNKVHRWIDGIPTALSLARKIISQWRKMASVQT